MNDKNLAHWGTAPSPALLLIPVFGGLLMAVMALAIYPEKPVTATTVAVVWCFISLVGSSTYHLFRAQQKRIAKCETDLARLSADK